MSAPQIVLIGDYEVTVQPTAEAALTLHHLVRGADVVRLPLSEAGAVVGWLRNPQRRIRELSNYRVIIGAAGDITWYLANGLRAAYLNPDQARLLARTLAQALPPSVLADDDLAP